MIDEEILNFHDEMYVNVFLIFFSFFLLTGLNFFFYARYFWHGQYLKARGALPLLWLEVDQN